MNRELLRRSYDRSAATYDQVFTHQQRPKIEALGAALPADARGPTLDVGAGTGLLARTLGGDPVQLDLSHGMLARGAGRRVQADLHQLPFRDNVFGTVWCVTALIDFTDAGPAIQSLARVLAPGGYLAISALKIEDLANLEAALGRVGPTVASLDLVQDLGFVVMKGS